MTRTEKRRTEAVPGRAIPPAQASMSSEMLMSVFFKGTGSRIVVGRESRQLYCFSSHDPEQLVDARDADTLLNTGLFRVGN